MAATDVLTLANAKAALGSVAVVEGRDAAIQRRVTAISQRLDQACGPIVRRTVTERHSGGRGVIRLRNAPVYSFTSITEWAAASSRVLTAEAAGVAGTYLAERSTVPDQTDLYSGRIWRRSGFGWDSFPYGNDNVVVVAVAGRYADTASVAGTRFEEAAVLFLKHLWSSEASSVAQVGEFDTPAPSFPRTMPLIIRQLLKDDWREDVVVA